MTVPQGQSSPAEGDDTLAVLVGEYFRRLREGESLDIEGFAREHLEHAQELRDLLPMIQALDDLGKRDPREEASSPANVSPDRTLGDFRIVREIGRGGMGIVYEAEQISLGRRVALKVLPFAAVLDQRHIQRFRNEAQAAAQLHHQNIVPVFAVGIERGVHYYAMQYIEGETLAEAIRELRARDEEKRADATPSPRSQAPPSSGTSSTGLSNTSTGSRDFMRAVARLGIQAARALDYAHEAGILHRDIKPSNMLLDTTGDVWVTDFGLARCRSDSGLTLTGEVLGTLRYMSPEQALGKRGVVDQRVDVYSLGVTLYELLTLAPAVRGKDREEILRHIAFEDPIRPRRLNPGISTELEMIVLKAISKSREERYETARELSEDLERFLENRPIRARPPSVFVRAQTWTRRHRTLVAAALVVMVSLVVTLLVSMVIIWRQKRITETALQETQIEVEARTDLLRRARYAGLLYNAYSAWRRKNCNRARGILEMLYPHPGEDDQRSFDWYFLWDILHRENRIFALPRGNGLAGRIDGGFPISPDGKTVAASGERGLNLLDVHTGESRGACKPPTGVFAEVAFSSKGNLVATTYRGKHALTLRDGTTLKGLGTRYLDGSRPLFSPDGTLLTAITRTGVKIWKTPDLTIGETISPGESVACAAFSPDGRILAIGCANGSVLLWDIAGKKTRRTLPVGAAEICALAWSPDGGSLATGSLDQTISACDLERGGTIAVPAAHSALIKSLAYSSDGHRLGSASADGSIKVWDLPSLKERMTLWGHSGEVDQILFLDDGSLLSGSRDDRTVREWRVEDPNPLRIVPERLRCRRTFQGHASMPHRLRINAAGLLAGQQTVWVAGRLSAENSALCSEILSMFRLRKSSPGAEELGYIHDFPWVQSLESDGRSSYSGEWAVSPDGSRIAVLSIGTKPENVIEIADLVWAGDESRKVRSSLLEIPERSRGELFFSEDGDRLAYVEDSTRRADERPYVYVWERETLQNTETWRLKTSCGIQHDVSGPFTTVFFRSRDLMYVFGRLRSGDQTYGIVILRMENPDEQSLVRVRCDTRITATALPEDGKLLVAGDELGTIRVWSLSGDDATQLGFFQAHEGAVGSVILARDGLLFSSGEKGVVRFWELIHLPESLFGVERGWFQAHSGAVVSMSLSGDGTTLLTASAEETRLWRAPCVSAPETTGLSRGER